MLQLLSGLPAHVAGVRATGSVDKAEYERVLLPELERVSKEFGEINFIMVLETSVGNFAASTWLEDIKQTIKHFAKWNKVAIVTDEKAMEKITSFASPLIPGEFKGYPISDIELAKTWVAAPKTAAG